MNLCERCHEPFEIGDWPICQDATGKHGHRRGMGSMSPRPMSAAEATVVWEHPVTGKISYPGRNDVPMPKRYADQGYQRKEMRTLREVDAFSAKHGVVNERAHFNSGNSIDGG